jgi:hypothetical protein
LYLKDGGNMGKVQVQQQKPTDSKKVVYEKLGLSPRGLTIDDLINQTGLSKRNIRRILTIIDGQGHLAKGLAGWNDMRKMRYKLRASE